MEHRLKNAHGGPTGVTEQLNDLLKQIHESWSQLENSPSEQSASSIFQDYRDLLVSAASVNSASINRELAAKVLEKWSYLAPRELWLDVTVRRRIVDFVQPPQSPAALNTAVAVPWQKHGAQCLENFTADEHVAKIFMHPHSDDDPEGWRALKRSAKPPRANVEKQVSLGAMANLATIPSNRSRMWRDVEAREALALGMKTVGVGCKPVRQSACRVLAFLAEDPALRDAMAEESEWKELEFFWREAAAKHIPDSPDELIEYALALLAKRDGVEFTGERSKADIDRQKRKAAIDLEDEDEERRNLRTPAKRAKVEETAAPPLDTTPLIGPPSSHNGTRDSNAALGSAFNTAGKTNTAPPAASSSGAAGSSRSNPAGSTSAPAGPSGLAPPATMAAMLEKLASEFPACRGLPGFAVVEHVEKKLYGKAQSGSLKRRACELMNEMLS